MSSVSGLSRTRSLRRPTVRGNIESNNESAPIRNVTGTRTTSPSRLPVKPLTRSASAKVSTSTTSTARTAPTNRPVSGILSSRKVSNPSPSTTTTSTATSTTKPLGRALSTRQAPTSATTTKTTTPTSTSTALSRTTSTTTRPKSSGGPPSVTSARERQTGHSRAKSTVTNLTSATTLRPVSTLSSSTSTSASTTTTTTSSTPTATTTKPVTRSQTHSRTKSQPYSQSQLPASPKQNTTTASTSTQPQRPAFNTLQQHYSPAKNLAPKPLTSTFLAPPSPSKLPANVAISSETSRLQTELLQLSLLHRDATAVDAEWHASARQKLGARFARLATADADITQLERSGVEARNISALLRWGSADEPSSSSRKMALDEKVQLLDQVLTGVWNLSEPEGRYQRTVSAFESWASRAAAILAAQRIGDVDALLEGDDVVFVSELASAQTWKRDRAGLARVLEGWRDTLHDLGDAGEEPDAVDAGHSGLARALRCARTLVHDMLAELETMARIEREALAAEEQWIESMNDELRANDTQKKDDVPLWKMLL
ncbi:hypothetical protein F4810DRAFT_546627 [Camillea tinctor]|nr:hypothetical protein F4810DRAFT_546627 [Camillea tinctor]